MSKVELDYFKIENAYGGCQDWFTERMMKLGGCGAATACDVCIYLKKYYGYNNLYPFEIDNLTKNDYVRFASMMRPYLSPRMSGIDRLDIYTDGFGSYLKDCDDTNIQLRELSGKENATIAKEAVINQIDKGYPIPCLVLHHKNKRMKEYVWHWFLLNGYEAYGEKLMVKAVTYGEWEWLDFDELWDTGHRRKGGLILLEEKDRT